MKRFSKFSVIVLIGFCSDTIWSGEALMSVQVKSSQIRASPSFLGGILAEIKYGDRVAVVDEQNGWMKVSLPDGRQGWVHGSALTRKKIVLSAGTTDSTSGASADELALAGKGFNSDVEAEFRAQNKDLDFTWVDRMEKIVIDLKTIQRFLEEGRVSPQTGALP